MIRGSARAQRLAKRLQRNVNPKKVDTEALAKFVKNRDYANVILVAKRILASSSSTTETKKKQTKPNKTTTPMNSPIMSPQSPHWSRPSSLSLEEGEKHYYSPQSPRWSDEPRNHSSPRYHTCFTCRENDACTCYSTPSTIHHSPQYHPCYCGNDTCTCLDSSSSSSSSSSPIVHSSPQYHPCYSNRENQACECTNSCECTN